MQALLLLINPQHNIDAKTVLLSVVSTRPSASCPVFDGDQDDHELSLEAVQEGFSMKLRDETDLVALSDDPVGVVWETMRSAHVSLWLHPATLQKSKESD